MQKKAATALFGFFLLLVMGIATAADQASLGSIATDLMGPADMVTRLVHLVCMIVGLILLFVAFSMFKANRFNPKFVPLERPIIIGLLGLTLIMLPFYSKIFFHPTGGIHDSAAARGIYTNDPDAPLGDEWGNDYDH